MATFRRENSLTSYRSTITGKGWGEHPLNAYTVSGWVKIASTPTTAYGILSTRFGGDNTFDLKVNSNLIHGDIGDGTNWISIVADIAATDTGSNGQGGQLAAGNWYLVTYAIDNTAKQFRLHINGDLKKTIAFTGTPLLMKSGETLEIGNSHGSEYMNGAIDDVRIYNRALSNTEVTSVYNAGNAPTNHAPAFTADPFTKSAATQNAAYKGSIAGDASDPDTGDTLTFSNGCSPHPFPVIVER